MEKVFERINKASNIDELFEISVDYGIWSSIDVFKNPKHYGIADKKRLLICKVLCARYDFIKYRSRLKR